MTIESIMPESTKYSEDLEEFVFSKLEFSKDRFGFNDKRHKSFCLAVAFATIDLAIEMLVAIGVSKKEFLFIASDSYNTHINKKKLND